MELSFDLFYEDNIAQIPKAEKEIILKMYKPISHMSRNVDIPNKLLMSRL